MKPFDKPGEYKKIAEYVLSFLLSGLFIYAGVLKGMDPEGFAHTVKSYEMLPAFFIYPVAMVLPAWEALAGLLIWIPRTRRAALLSILVMCGIFLVALLAALARGLEVDCGCFGAGEATGKGVWIALGRDLVLITCSFWLYLQALGTEPRTKPDDRVVTVN